MKQILKKVLSIFTASVLPFSACALPENISPTLADGYVGFLSTSGTQIVDEDGKPYLIKAMGFGNHAINYITDSSRVNGIHHTEESYKELSEMGFNSVRFLLNYNLFESDDEPFVYREEGFDWIDINIEWAKKYGMRIILDMHSPQGGYQSWDREKYKFDGLDEGDALWMNTEYQKRLTALWAEIAKHYADEPTIIGYSFVNEPVVAIDGLDYNNLEDPGYQECFDLYRELIENTTAAVREHDKNHIIFVSRIFAFKDINKSWGKWIDANSDYNFIFIDDPNAAYEFHFYKPYDYITQEPKSETPLMYGEGKDMEFKDIVIFLDQFKEFSEKYNVPLFCGEYGLRNHCFHENIYGENKGGAQWVSDVLGYFLENGIGSGYHSYYGGTYARKDLGMYVTWDKIEVGGIDREAILYNALKETFSRYN